MKKLSQILVVTLLLGTFIFAGSVPAASARAPHILQFDTMIGLPSTLTGLQSNSPLRGINGGGLPWVVGSAMGSLTASGHLKIEVQGLVLATTGGNPVPNFRGLVSCVRSDGSFDNILTTATFPATTGPASSGGGDADIEADVALPQPCIAPIIFVTNPTGAWFAATGN